MSSSQPAGPAPMIGAPTLPAVGAPTLPVPGDVELRREGVRGRIALILLAIFAAEIAVALISQLGPSPATTMKDVMLIVFGPTVALVGSALGFYYGRPDGRVDR